MIMLFLFLGIRENFNKVKDNILSADYFIFLGAVALYIVVSFIGALRFKYLLSVQNIKLSFKDLLKNIYIGYLFNLFLLGSTGGDAIRSYYIAKQTHAKAEIVTMVFFDRLVGVLTMMLIAFCSLVFNLHDSRLKNMLVVVVIMIVLISIFFAVVFNKDKIKNIKLVKNIFGKIFFRDILKRIVNTIYLFKDNKKMILVGMFFSALIQSLAIIDSYIVAKSMGNIESIPLKYFFLMMPIIFMGSALPVSLGGWGVFEWGFVVCFGMVGVKSADALSIGLMNRFVLIILGIIGAVIYIMPGTNHYAAEALEENLS